MRKGGEKLLVHPRSWVDEVTLVHDQVAVVSEELRVLVYAPNGSEDDLSTLFASQGCAVDRSALRVA